MTRDEFLTLIKEYVKTDPTVVFDLNRVKDRMEGAAYLGLVDRMHGLAERAVDMETIASAALGRKSQATDQLIRQKLEKWRDRCSLKWDWYLDSE